MRLGFFKVNTYRRTQNQAFTSPEHAGWSGGCSIMEHVFDSQSISFFNKFPEYSKPLPLGYNTLASDLLASWIIYLETFLS